MSTDISSGTVLAVAPGETATGDTVDSGGTLDVGSGGSVVDTVLNGGSVLVESGGSASDTTINNGGTLEIQNGGALSVSVTFGDSGTLQIDSSVMPAATIYNFISPTQTIDLRGLDFTGSGAATLTSNNVLQITEGSQTVSLQLDPSQSYAGHTFTLTNDGHGGTAVVDPSISVTATTDQQLWNDIYTVDSFSATENVNWVINVAGTINLTRALEAIDLVSGSLTIEGTNGSGAAAVQTINGQGSERGFFVYSGNVTLQNLDITNTLAKGGNGVDGGGGGAGLGGGLFVAGVSAGNPHGSGGHVTLNNVSFSGDVAQGGAGGGGRSWGGGGGGLGGGGGGGTNGGGGGGGIGGPGPSSGNGGSGGGDGEGRGGNGAAGLAAGNYGNGNFIAGSGGTAGQNAYPGAGGAFGGGGGGGGGGGADNTQGGGGGGGGIYGGQGAGADGQGFGGAGGAGGYGGGGGGAGGPRFSGASEGVGGNGGFGGGGGAGGPSAPDGASFFGGGTGGNGGYGGGGGAGWDKGGNGGTGAAGGTGDLERGAAAGGGGGLGAGGDIFVQQGGSLTIEGDSLGTGTIGQGTAIGGAGGSNAVNTAGDGWGNGIFLQGTQSITFSPASGQTETISGTIASNAGTGSVIVNGGGTVVLAAPTSAPNSYNGGTTVSGSGTTLAFYAGVDLGTGTVALNAGAVLEALGSTTVTTAIAISGDPTIETIPGAKLVVSGGAITGSGGLTINGGGTVDLAKANNTYSGGTTITGKSTLEIGVANAVPGTITFSGAGDTLKIDGTTMPTNTIAGIGADDAIDLANVGFQTTSGGNWAGTATIASGNKLQVTENGTTYTLQLDPNANYSGDYVDLINDGNGGTDVFIANNLLVDGDFNVVNLAGNVPGVSTAGTAGPNTGTSPFGWTIVNGGAFAPSSTASDPVPTGFYGAQVAYLNLAYTGHPTNGSISQTFSTASLGEVTDHFVVSLDFSPRQTATGTATVTVMAGNVQIGTYTYTAGAGEVAVPVTFDTADVNLSLASPNITVSVANNTSQQLLVGDVSIKAISDNLIGDGNFNAINMSNVGQNGVQNGGAPGNYTSSAPPDWTFASGSGGLFAPTTVSSLSDTGSPAGFAGSDVAYINPNSTLEQSFTAPSAANGPDPLNVSLDLGTRKDAPATTGTVTVEVLSGSTVVGSTTFNPATATAGAANAVRLTISDLNASGLAGKPLTLAIASTGTGTAQILAGDVQVSGPLTFYASTEAQLTTDIQAINVGGTNAASNTAYQIDLTSGFTLTSQLTALNLSSGSSLAIEGTTSGGGGQVQTINGGGTYQGFFAYSGNISLVNLAIDSTKATGGNGRGPGGGGGGGAGLGGGLFVAGNTGGGGSAHVTLDNVSFQGDSAQGGNGGQWFAGFNTPGAGGALDGGIGPSGYGQQNQFGGGGYNGNAGFGGGAPNSYQFGQLLYGGTGGGRGNGTFGGGGLGAGGDIFVQKGGSLTIEGDGQISQGSVAGGSGPVTGPGYSASAWGQGLFLQSGTTTLAPSSGQTLEIDGTITDMQGVGYSGAATLAIDGPGTVYLTAGNAYSGGTVVEEGTLKFAPGAISGGALTIDSGATAKSVGSQTVAQAIAGAGGFEVTNLTNLTNGANSYSGGTVIDAGGWLQLGAVGAAGNGAITFSGASGSQSTLQLLAAGTPASGATFANTLTNFGANDALNIIGLTYAAGATATVGGSTLTVTSGSSTFKFNLATPTASTFYVHNDPSNGSVWVDTIPLASASVTPNPVNFGNHHVGDVVASQALTVTNTAASGAEKLDASAGSTTGGVSDSGTINLLATGASNNTSITVGISTAAAGSKNGTATINLTSDGSGTSGLGKTVLPAQTINVTGGVYRYATGNASLSVPSIVHVGDVVDLSVTNGATADGYSENLNAGIVSGPTGATASGAISELAAGGASSNIGLTFNTAGSVSGNLKVDFQSDGGTGAGSIDGLGATDLGDQTFAVSTTVDNYAVAQLDETSGGGTWRQSGNDYTLDLGTVIQNSAAIAIDLSQLNAASGQADLLEGSFATSSSSAFALAGFDAFSGLGAGQADTAPQVTFSTGTAGTFTETITVTAYGYNSSGYQDAAATQETLTITGTVAPSADDWAGPSARNRSGDFASAANWLGGALPNASNKAVFGTAATYTVTSAQDETVGGLVVGNANATLAIADASTFIVSGVINDAGMITVGDGATLQITRAVNDTGTIALEAATQTTTLALAANTALRGTGNVTLSDSSLNSIAATTSGVRLINDLTISGSGAIGAGGLALANGLTGTIDQTGSAGMTIGVTGTLLNQGIIEANGSGGLVITGAVNNKGTLAATDGDLTVTGAVTGISTNDTIANGNTLTFDGSVAATQQVNFTAGSAGTLALGAAESFAGTIAGFATGDAIDLADFAFSGGAKIVSVTDTTTGGGSEITTLRIKDGALVAKIALLNQTAGEFSTDKTAYTLSSDQQGTAPGTLLELAPSHTV